MTRKAALALALVVCAPTLYQALWQQTIGMETAVVRFLVALVACAVLIGGVEAAMSRRDRR